MVEWTDKNNSFNLYRFWSQELVGMVFCYQNCSEKNTLRKNCSRDREKLLNSRLKADDLNIL